MMNTKNQLLIKPNFLYVAVLLSLIFGCKESPQRSDSFTYFGGHIVNPKEDYVYLLEKDVLIDSAKLDEHHNFMMKFESIEEGLYNFKHAPEYQYVYIKPLDSILIRINTLEFDESLVYTGIGADLNNFLIEMYLFHEDEEPLMRRLFKLPPEEFVTALDSLTSMKREELGDLVKETRLSSNELKMAEASIDFPYYHHKEMYPYLHRNYLGKDHFDPLPTNFYSYRSAIDYNNDLLAHFRPYLYFLLTNVSNLSYNSEDLKYENSLEFNLNRVRMIDSLIQHEELKNDMLRFVSYEFLLRNQNMAENEAYLKEYFATSSSNKHDVEIDQLYHNIRNLQRGNAFPAVSIFTQQSEYAKLEEVENSKKARVYYFWSMDQKKHQRTILKKAYKLQKKYPNVEFVGININENHDRWLSACEKMNLPMKGQYRLASFKDMSEKLVISSLNKVIIVDKNNNIVDGFANINDLEDNKELASLKP